MKKNGQNIRYAYGFLSLFEGFKYGIINKKFNSIRAVPESCKIICKVEFLLTFLAISDYKGL